jgi:hypothetical protein
MTYFAPLYLQMSAPAALTRVQPFEQTKSFQPDLTIAGVKLSVIPSTLAWLRWWFKSSGPTVSGSISHAKDSIIVTLNLRWGKQQVPIVGSCASDSNIVQRQELVDSVAFRCRIFIEQPRSLGTTVRIRESTKEDLFRTGSKALEGYANTGETTRRDQALNCFNQIIQLGDDFHEARFLRGAIMIFQGRQREAADEFRLIYKSIEVDSDSELKRRIPDLGKRARYYEAVALSQLYRPDVLRRVDIRLAKLLGDEPPFEKSPVLAMAASLRVQCWTTQILFWQEIMGGGASEEEDKIRSKKKVCAGTLQSHVGAGYKLLDELERVVTSGNLPDAWTVQESSELLWSTTNFRGNLNLTQAIRFYVYPYVQSERDFERLRQRKLLESAKEAYVKCLESFPANVFTLLNLATVELFLGEYITCRDYCRRAQGLMPHDPEDQYALLRSCGALDREAEEHGARARCLEWRSRLEEQAGTTTTSAAQRESFGERLERLENDLHGRNDQVARIDPRDLERQLEELAILADRTLGEDQNAEGRKKLLGRRYQRAVAKASERKQACKAELESQRTPRVTLPELRELYRKYEISSEASQ